MITNNPDLYNYMRDRGVWCTYVTQPSLKWNTDELAIIFPDTHAANVSCNAHAEKYEDLYRKECDDIIKWMQCSSRVIIVTPVIKFDSEYMKTVATEQYEKLCKLHINYKKQVIDTFKLGELVGASRLQLRYKGVNTINFDIVNMNGIKRPKYKWIDKKTGKQKQQDVHYLNVINKTTDKYERRKLRYIPHYTLFSQLYKKLKESGKLWNVMD